MDNSVWALLFFWGGAAAFPQVIPNQTRLYLLDIWPLISFFLTPRKLYRIPGRLIIEFLGLPGTGLILRIQGTLLLPEPYCLKDYDPEHFFIRKVTL